MNLLPDGRFAWCDEQALKDNTTGFVSMVLAAPLVTSEWAGFGFSGPGQMAGSTAVVTTLGVTGEPVVQQYFLKDQDLNQVFKDDTRLTLTQAIEAFYNATSKTVYVGFQVNFATSKAIPNYLLYAQGPASGDGSTISYHRAQSMDKLSNSQFPIGVVGQSEASKLDKQVKAHGALQVFGWGVLLPIGAMVARYAREYDPAWFYIHITFQITGFIFIIAGVATGVNLAKSFSTPGLTGHKGLGIFLFTLAILQVLAVVLRPKKDANIRKYWNWYHWWVGRLALFLAVINIFVGLNLGKEEKRLKVSYIVLLAFELVAFAILETIYWLRWNRDPGTGNRWNRSSTERSFQMADNY
ncbi:hypothetical protein M758_1G227900 [Ceratodon purpureus]|uniref:Cytochrome b561 and DOMON domain-containing protein n=1 Tax=Ceratodon purpureus TaxID=3225 RepID=A0A8T0J7N2_CERPU|nr:hypothetical protein KC19_1G191800 [Ceratodon purpureus]KAG0631106.1 hypothetical protein M758_1G227900 [Ceratodon purpureus]